MEAMQEVRLKSHFMSCHHLFRHACIHYILHPRKYLSSMYYVSGSGLLPNNFDLERNQSGGRSEGEDWEHHSC